MLYLYDCIIQAESNRLNRHHNRLNKEIILIINSIYLSYELVIFGKDLSGVHSTEFVDSCVLLICEKGYNIDYKF